MGNRTTPPRPDTEADPTPSPHESVQLLAERTAADPNCASGQLSLGCACEQLGELGQARTHLANALRLDPSLEATVQSLFGRMYVREGQWINAIAAADRALQADPLNYVAHLVRSRSCAALARMEEAVESSRRSIGIALNKEFHSGLLTEMNYLADVTPEALYVEACRWNAEYAAPMAPRIRPHANAPDPDRRLKVGYVSPEFCHHAMMKFLPPVFEHHDRSHFEVFAYSTGVKSDEWTETLRSRADGFASIRDPEILAERVRADGIDILIDLAGHTMGLAYLAFALKPTPVQVAWLGALSTTGFTTMDYFLGDAHMPCPGTEHLFTETVYRLPQSSCCYRPFYDIPVAPAPLLERGYITFGSFNNPRKITREVAKLWSAILHLVPGSRLLLKYGGFDTQVMQERFYVWFMEDGISAERLRFEGAVPPREYLEAFRNIDIALDPFPYNGGSTTLDTLWMGVPVVTLTGRLVVQCTGSSVLTAVGLSDLVAKTPEQYLNVALRLAVMVANMPNLRHDVRQSMLSSPIMDEIGHVRHLENAYRDMWRKWCQTRS